jgi:uncharacterized membrane protein (DUF106 family)
VVVILIEIVVCGLFVSQVGYPWTVGRPLFPAFRRRRREIEKDLKELQAEEVQEALEAERRERAEALESYRKSLKKEGGQTDAENL